MKLLTIRAGQTFEHEGKKYKAVNQGVEITCRGCSFYNFKKGTCNVSEVIDCDSKVRSVRFVEVC